MEGRITRELDLHRSLNALAKLRKDAESRSAVVGPERAYGPAPAPDEPNSEPESPTSGEPDAEPQAKAPNDPKLARRLGSTFKPWTTSDDSSDASPAPEASDAEAPDGLPTGPEGA